MTSIQKKKSPKAPKTPEDNSLLSAYVDSPTSTTNAETRANISEDDRIGDGGSDKRNPHVIDDRQRPITKKNKNRKKLEAQRKSQSEGQDSETLQVNGTRDLTDDVVDSWEDIQDGGTSDTLPPPPPEFVIDEKAVEERKKKELQEAEILAKKLEQTSISSPDNQSKKSKQQNSGGKKKVAKVVGNAKINEYSNISKESYVKENVPEKITSRPENTNQEREPEGPALQQCPQSFNVDELKKALSVLKITIEDVGETFKKGPTGVAGPVLYGVTEENYKQSQKDTSSLKESTPTSANINKEEKTKEDIKAEREAKKQAKQSARALTKDKSAFKNETENIAQNSDKSPLNVAKKVDAISNQITSEGMSKAELKAERRAKQEAQRATKSNATTPKPQESDKKKQLLAQGTVETGGKTSGTKPNQSRKVPDDRQVDRASVEKKILKKLASQNIPSRTVAQRKVKLFDHLHQYEREYSISKPFPVVNSHIHPAVLQLGLKYSEGTIQGSNARCLAFMQAMKQLISDYKTQSSLGDNSNDYQDTLRRVSTDLSGILDTHIAFLKNCRTHSVSMGNAIRLLKTRIQLIGKGTGLEEIKQESQIEECAKQILFDSIDTFVDHVGLAAVQISDTAYNKIKDGDVILTYGCSSLLKEVFLVAAKRGRKFKVVVADGRPRFEGREMARHLVQAGIHTTYILVQSVSYIISEVTKVFLGAHAVFANGCVMSRVGTSQVALIAKSQNVPVLVCCETYKFSEKVQTDSFVFNELGDPDDLVATGSKTNALEEWRDLSKLCVLNLSYDVTPASLVDAIISEISVIPTTSVPVILRLKSMDQAL